MSFACLIMIKIDFVLWKRTSVVFVDTEYSFQWELCHELHVCLFDKWNFNPLADMRKCWQRKMRWYWNSEFPLSCKVNTLWQCKTISFMNKLSVFCERPVAFYSACFTHRARCIHEACLIKRFIFWSILYILDCASGLEFCVFFFQNWIFQFLFVSLGAN